MIVYIMYSFYIPPLKSRVLEREEVGHNYSHHFPVTQASSLPVAICYINIPRVWERLNHQGKIPSLLID